MGKALRAFWAEVGPLVKDSEKGVAIESMTVTPENPKIQFGSRQQFTAQAKFVDGTSRDVTSEVEWVSLDRAVVAINKTGLAIALGQGATTIQATHESGSFVAGTEVAVLGGPAPARLLSITVTPERVSLKSGEGRQFIAQGKFSNNATEDITLEVLWISGEPEVVAIENKTGFARAKRVSGSKTVRIAAKDPESGTIGTAVVTVQGSQAPPQPPGVLLVSLTISPQDPTLAPGAKQQFTAQGKFDNGLTRDVTGEVAWESSEPTVISIDKAGLATAKAAGTAHILATHGEGVDVADTEVTVTPPPPPAGTFVSSVVVMNNTAVPLKKLRAPLNAGTYEKEPDDPVPAGKPIKFSVRSQKHPTEDRHVLVGNLSLQPEGADGDEDTWEIAYDATSDVEKGHAATEVFNGKTLAADTPDIKGRNFVFSVRPAGQQAPALKSIGIVPGNATFEAGEQWQFAATGQLSDGTNKDVTKDVEWASSADEIASVSKSGLVTAGQVAGKTIISARDPKSGTEGKANLTVKGGTPPPQPGLQSIAIEPANGSFDVNSTIPFTAQGKFADGDKDVTSQVVFSSSAEGVVKFLAGNMATAVAAGSAKITAVDPASGVSGTTGVTVNGGTPPKPEPEFNPPERETEPTLRMTNKTADGWVEHLQELLNVALKPSPNLKVDGDFGPATQKAVMAYQKQEGIQPDGVVGNQTWAQLRHTAARPPSADKRSGAVADKGKKARWFDGEEPAFYDATTKKLTLLLVSVGDTRLDDKDEATVRVTRPGKTTVVKAPIGQGFGGREGQGERHQVIIENFLETYPSEPAGAALKDYFIEAYFDKALGGDFWKGKIAEWKG